MKSIIVLLAVVFSFSFANNLEAKTSSVNIIKSTVKVEKAIPSGRCKATTKKGAQCKRKATASGYCWQHSK